MAACPPTKDRDSANVLSAGAAISAGVSSHHGLKARNKPLAPKSDSLSCNKRLQNKETEAKLGNLQVAELQALLDEAFQYRGNRDGEQQTELFQALLRETQESGGESPPAFRPTPSQPAQHRRRRSRKESSCLLSNIAVPPSVHSTTVASSNRKGGSLQNISHTVTQSSHQGVRNRKRHDTSDSWGTILGSPRKREGGSLPSDVTRGSKKQEAESQKSSQSVLVMGVGQTDHSPQSSKDVIIDMDGVVQDITLSSKSVLLEDQDTFTQPWNCQLTSKSSINSPEPTEEDSGLKSSASCHTSSESTAMTDAEASVTKKLLSMTKRQTESGGTYGSLSYKPAGAPQEVDDSIPFSLSHMVVNGTASDEGSARRIFRGGPGSDSVVDENGNPFPLRNGPSGGQMSTTAQQPTRTSPQSSTVTNALANKSSRSKKKGKDGDGVFSEQMPGFLGDRDVNELLEYIESSDVGGKRGVVTSNGESWNKKNNGSKNNNIGSHLSNKDTSSKIKTKKSSKLTRASGTAVRNEESADESDTAADQQISPDGLEDFLFSARARNDFSVVAPNKFGALIPATDSVAVDELEATLAATADFQTVTKKQRRKKRNNSIGASNSAASGSASAMTNGRKDFFEHANMTLFYNSTSASPSRHQARRQIGAGGVGSAPGGEMKKVVASVPPSEPSDVDSDGGDSVHSLPVQPSAPLFPSLPPPAPGPASLMVPILIPAPVAASNAISYADIIRSEHGKSDVSFIAESSQPDDIKSVQPVSSASVLADPAPPLTNCAAPAAPAVVNVPSQRAPVPASSAAKSRGPYGGRLPLRRAASLPPTSPSVDTPPVVIIGASSTTEVDVTFGFELNEQLLALSSSASSPTSAPLVVEQPLLQPEQPVQSPKEGYCNPQETKVTPPAPTVRPDFAARYRERPDLASPTVSQRTIEIVDFISQAWNRIQKKLEEQQHQQLHEINSVGLPSQTSIRVYYTLE